MSARPDRAAAKLGTVVSNRAGKRPVSEIWDTAEIVRRQGSVYGDKLLSCAFVGDSPENRALLGVRSSVQVIRMTCLNTADEAPFQV